MAQPPVAARPDPPGRATHKTNATKTNLPESSPTESEGPMRRLSTLLVSCLLLISSVRAEENLNVLDPQLTPHWPAVPPVGYRDGFYTGSQMLQLMENVYLDLRLDESWDHADNAGWRATFLTWGQSAIVKDAWQLSKKTYGKRFGHFCQRELKLK